MSAEAAPATEPEVVQPVQDIEPKTPESQKPLTFNLGAALKHHSSEKLRTSEIKKAKVEPPKEQPKAEPPKDEPKKEEKAQFIPDKKDEPKAEPTKDRITEPKTNSERFRMLEQERDEARQAREALEAELNALREKATGSETLTQRLAEYEKKQEELAKERDTYREKVRALDIQSDPEFTKNFVEPIQREQQELFNMLTKAGVDRNAAIEAINQWDDSAFEEITDSLPSLTKSKIVSQISEVEKLDRARQKELADSKQLGEKLSQQKEQNRRATILQRESEAERVMSAFLKDVPQLADDEDFQKAVTADIAKASREEIPHVELADRFIRLHAFERIASLQAENLKALKKELADKDAKIADLEKFAKDQSGSPDGGESSVGAPGSAYVPLSKRISVR